VREGVYLDTANFGLLATPVMDAVSEVLKELTNLPQSGASQRWLGLEADGARARNEVASLVGAAPEEIALVESTSHGLQIAAASIPLSAGDEVLMAGWDFVGVPLAWRPLVERKGIRLRTVDLHQASDPTAALVGALRPETRVVCTSSVTETLGTRLSLPRLAEACHAQDTWVVADVMQEAGVRRMELSGSGVDFAVSGGHKWLGCPFGVGFLYIRSERLPDLEASTVGYAGLEEPEGGWDGYFSSPTPGPLEELPPSQAARRFEIGGTPNFIGRFALAESSTLLNQLGIDQVEERVLALTGVLWDNLAAAGFTVATPRSPEARAGIVCFTAGDPARDQELARRLTDQGVYVSCRYRRGIGGARASMHFYNNQEDIEQLIAALERRRNQHA
jgi:selenocysteine lyase/cysteine desulfurase